MARPAQGDGDHLRVRAIGLGELLVLVKSQGDGRRHHKDATVGIVLRRRLERGLDAHYWKGGQLPAKNFFLSGVNAIRSVGRSNEKANKGDDYRWIERFR